MAEILKKLKQGRFLSEREITLLEEYAIETEREIEIPNFGKQAMDEKTKFDLW